MKKLICTLAVGLTFFQFVKAQNEICYTYDAAGNRTVKNICCTNCSQTRSESENEMELLESNLSQLIVMPNPTTGLFRLNADNIPVGAKVRIYNASGALINYRLLGDGNFDISYYPSGVYMIEIMYDGKRRSTLFEKTSF